MMSAITELFNFIELMTIIICAICPAFADARFTELPSSVNVTAGDEAVFRCQHSVAEFIGWRVNNMSLRDTSVPGVSLGTDGSLTILALPENNGTLVECVALFTDGTLPILSPPAILIVQGNCNSTVAIAFIEEPESQSVVIGEVAEFRCRHPTADYIGWTVNGTSLTNFTPGNVSTKSISIPDGVSARRYVVIVGAIPTYNGTIVICVAVFGNHCPSQYSDPAVLLIQGPLQAVSEIIRGFISEKTFSWTPPPSLDLTNVEPDIAYCIFIHNITCGRQEFLISDCSLVNPFYIYENIYPGLLYRVKVIPRSNVDRAANGTPLSIDEQFIDYQVTRLRLIWDVDTQKINASFTFTRNTNVSGYRILPDQYHVIIAAIDDIDKDPLRITETVLGDLHNMSFVLPSRRLWMCDLLAYGCNEHSLASFGISTYEIQNISATSPRSGELLVTGNLIALSMDVGILLLVYSFTNKSDVHYFSSKSHQQIIQARATYLSGGTYGISVFILEENGLPFSRVAALPLRQQVEYRSTDEMQPRGIEYEVQQNASGVCIHCTFHESSAQDCVVIVHKKIPPLNSSGLMNIQSSYKFTRSGDTASGCILEGINHTDYQVGVMNGTMVRLQGLSKYPGDVMTWIIVAVIIGLTVCAIVIIIVVPLVVAFILKKIHGQNKLVLPGPPSDQSVDVSLNDISKPYQQQDSGDRIEELLSSLLPFQLNWRVIANVFHLTRKEIVSVESGSKTGEDRLREILVISVDKRDFQLKYDKVLTHLKNSAEEHRQSEVEIGKEVDAEGGEKESSPLNGKSVMESTMTSDGCTENVVVPDAPVIQKSVNTHGSSTVKSTMPVHCQASDTKPNEYDVTVKRQIRRQTMATENEVDDLHKGKEHVVRPNTPVENADMTGLPKQVKPHTESSTTNKTQLSRDIEIPTEQTVEASGVSFPDNHPVHKFDEEDSVKFQAAQEVQAEEPTTPDK